MRPLVMDFGNDSKAVAQAYQYMFGKAFLIAPVTEANVTQWDVYLPKAAGWYDYWTGKHFDGGQTVKADAPQDKIPVFIKAGSIVPMAQQMQYTSEKNWDNLEIRVYPGANADFTLYEDEKDNYNYEKGKYSEVTFHWDDKQHTLSIANRKGEFKGMLAKRTFNIVMEGANAGSAKSVSYNGLKKSIRL